jgi:serine/threonine protein kinase
MPSLLSNPRPKRSSSHPGWGFEEPREIAPGRVTIKPVGGGSLYEVFLVWDETLHSLCVAKLVRPDQVDDDHALRDLRREAEVLEALAHPVIVRSFDLVDGGPHPHLLLEHLEGPSLRRLIRRGGPLPLQQLLPVALSVAGALHYLAARGYVHLDVKPDNIVVGVPPRLIDLSIARTPDRARRARSPIGTDAYMAPEQCDPGRLASRIGPATDVFGLGATLHHAIGGRKPFPPLERPDGERERFPQLFDGPRPLPDHVPAPLVELLEQMLAFDPGERPTATEVAARLEPLVAELPKKISLSRRLLS